LIPSGVQLWYKDVVLVTNERLFYCSTISVYVFRLSDYALERILTGHQSAITALKSSPHLPMIASSSLDQSIRLWDVTNGKCIKVVNTTQGGDFKPIALDWNVATHAELACSGRKGIRIKIL
jgi:WD40 repeat protein